MAKRKSCAACGNKKPPKGWQLVWDPKQNKAVNVCAGSQRCQAPYVRRVTTLETSAKVRTVAGHSA